MKQKTEKTKGDIYRTELLKIKEEVGLTAENVVKKAKDKKSPLHEYFIWDNNIAGERWRIHQARLLINYMIEPPHSENPREYSFEIVGQEYEHIDDILSNDDWRKRIVEQAIGHLKYWQKKYSKYKISEFSGIMSEIEKLNDKQNKKQHGRVAEVTA